VLHARSAGHGSLTLNESPGADKESNWLPPPTYCRRKPSIDVDARQRYVGAPNGEVRLIALNPLGE
jgi:hypothetical protein